MLAILIRAAWTVSGIILLHYTPLQTHCLYSQLLPTNIMVAIRSLLLAGAFAGMSAAAQVGIVADCVPVPTGCMSDVCCTLDVCARQAPASHPDP